MVMVTNGGGCDDDGDKWWWLWWWWWQMVLVVITNCSTGGDSGHIKVLGLAHKGFDGTEPFWGSLGTPHFLVMDYLGPYLIWSEIVFRWKFFDGHTNSSSSSRRPAQGRLSVYSSTKDLTCVRQYNVVNIGDGIIFATFIRISRCWSLPNRSRKFLVIRSRNGIVSCHL